MRKKLILFAGVLSLCASMAQAELTITSINDKDAKFDLQPGASFFHIEIEPLPADAAFSNFLSTAPAWTGYQSDVLAAEWASGQTAVTFDLLGATANAPFTLYVYGFKDGKIDRYSAFYAADVSWAGSEWAVTPLPNLPVDRFDFAPEVPEPATLLAGALLLLPFGATALRLFRRDRT